MERPLECFPTSCLSLGGSVCHALVRCVSSSNSEVGLGLRHEVLVQESHAIAKAVSVNDPSPRVESSTRRLPMLPDFPTCHHAEPQDKAALRGNTYMNMFYNRAYSVKHVHTSICTSIQLRHADPSIHQSMCLSIKLTNYCFVTTACSSISVYQSIYLSIFL